MLPSPVILRTNRLLLRELGTDDAPFIVELVNTPGWLKFIGERNIRSVDQAKTYLEEGPIKSYRENGFGLWGVGLKESDTLIGMCGLLKRDALAHPDIGYAFLPAYTGKGYAIEIAQATMDYAKTKLNITTLCAITHPENATSIRLLGKIGMRFKEKLSFKEGEDSLLFSNE